MASARRARAGGARSRAKSARAASHRVLIRYCSGRTFPGQRGRAARRGATIMIVRLLIVLREGCSTGSRR
eukprot:753208-Rhodomonas_salina.1